MSNWNGESQAGWLLVCSFYSIECAVPPLQGNYKVSVCPNSQSSIKVAKKGQDANVFARLKRVRSVCSALARFPPYFDMFLVTNREQQVERFREKNKIEIRKK
eukprot:GHVT01055348.1.p2 GENE.GHVT01055348.1~~GHVT01055348.1.p2  ORF type:complete len:103 (-),score=8.70 GHVT01055348.1:181-489(-)